MSRISLLMTIASVAALLSSQAPANWIVPVEHHVQVQSGKPACLGVLFDCRSHVPYQGTAFAQHGKLTYRDVTLNQCGNAREPGRAVCYLPDPGYKGPDEVTFPVSGGMGAIFHVNVR